MRTDYFDNLVPTVPTSKSTSGDAENPHKHCASPPSPPENGEAEKTNSGQVLHTNYGAGHPDAKPPEPMPTPAVAWPQALSVTLNRVATAFEWTPQDRQDFIAWARRDQQGIDDARQFLEAECAKLPKPDQSERT